MRYFTAHLFRAEAVSNPIPTRISPRAMRMAFVVACFLAGAVLFFSHGLLKGDYLPH